METDRELLELAAKAAGVELFWCGDKPITQARGYWNPRNDDGDTLRLAAETGLEIFFDDKFCRSSQQSGGEHTTFWGEDEECKNVREAVVRVAAEIGKAMP